MRYALVPLALLTLACGSKSGLSQPAPPAPTAPDAGTIMATLPCRWSVGVPVEIAQSAIGGAGYADLGGGTVGTRDSVLNRAVVTATDRESGAHVGALVTTAGVGELLVPYRRDGPVRWLAGLERFVAQPLDECTLELFNLELGGPRRVELRLPPARCAFSQASVEPLEMIVLDGGGGAVVERIRDLASAPIFEPLLETRTDAPDAVDVFHQPGLGTMVLARSAAGVFVERHASVVDVSGALDVAGPVSAAPDRLLGGLIVLRLATRGGWVLERYAYGGPLEAIELLDLSALPAPPIGRVASNETEALVPLADGSMLYVILSSPRVRLVNMEDVPVVSAMEIIVRPDDSAGGLLYVTDTALRSTLSFVPLTCNR